MRLGNLGGGWPHNLMDNRNMFGVDKRFCSKANRFHLRHFVGKSIKIIKIKPGRINRGNARGSAGHNNFGARRDQRFP